jgi:hypothetical protein
MKRREFITLLGGVANSLSAVGGLPVTAVVSGFGSGAKWQFRCVLALEA